MKLADSLVLLGVAALPLAAPLVDDASPKPKAPVIVIGRDVAAPQDDAASRKKIEELVALLGSADAKARHDAQEALKRLGEQARAALQEATKSADAETRFSATQLLDRLDVQQQSRANARSAVGGRLRERALDPGDTAPPEGAEQDDAARTARGLHGLFDDARLQELHERMVRRMEELFHGEDPFGEALRGQQGTLFRLDRQGAGLELGPGSSFSREVDRDGHKESVKITVDAEGRAKAVVVKDGEPSTYEADSFDALKKEHPELVEGSGALRFTLRTPELPALPELPRGSLRDTLRDSQRAPRVLRPPVATPPQEAPVADGPRLGVRVEPVDPKVAEYLELEEGLGLRVVEVVPDGAADHLGVLKNDIVLTVNGRTIRGVADVQAALKDKDPTQADVTVLRKGLKRDL